MDEAENDQFNRRFYKQTETKFEKELKISGLSLQSKASNDYRSKEYYKKWVNERLPIINWLFLGYNFKSFLLNDIISGFTVGIMNLPQSMGYALLANLAPVNGLYMSFFPLLIYAVFGTSKHIAIGMTVSRHYNSILKIHIVFKVQLQL
jgi:hypothetical protein